MIYKPILIDCQPRGSGPLSGHRLARYRTRRFAAVVGRYVNTPGELDLELVAKAGQPPGTHFSGISVRDYRERVSSMGWSMRRPPCPTCGEDDAISRAVLASLARMMKKPVGAASDAEERGAARPPANSID